MRIVPRCLGLSTKMLILYHSRTFTRSPSLSPFRQFRFVTIRKYSEQASPTATSIYRTEPHVAFIEVPPAKSYVSSSNDELDSQLAATSDQAPDSEAVNRAAKSMQSNPVRIRVVFPECQSLLIFEKQSSNSADEVQITLQSGLHASDDSAAPRQKDASSSELASDVSEIEGMVTTRSWPDPISAMRFSGWAGSSDGRLESLTLQRDGYKQAGTNRGALKALVISGTDDVPSEVAMSLLWLYGVARTLNIEKLEQHLFQQWRRNFDIMPEFPHIYMWALQTLHENGLKDSPLVSVLQDQFAYSFLWIFDVINNPQDQLAPLEMWMDKVPNLLTSMLEQQGTAHPGLEDQLKAKMYRLISNAAAERTDGLCDFVTIDKSIIYKETFNQEIFMKWGKEKLQNAV